MMDYLRNSIIISVVSAVFATLFASLSAYAITRFSFPAHSGLLDLGKNALLYVNRGSGTWGPPIRFLAPPEVTIIELVHEPA